MIKEDKLNTKMITPVIRCMFPKLAEVDEKSGKYGLSIPLPKADKAACDALVAATGEFAARRMDKAIRQALTGNRVDNLPL